MQFQFSGKSLLAIALSVSIASLGGCGNVSRNVAKDGASAGQLVWPSPDSTNPLHRGGTYPLNEAVRRVQPGLDKHQIMALIGPPHFNEGFFGVREWNYVFNLEDPASNNVRVCQFKILFDDNRIARSVYWKPEDCAALVRPRKSEVEQRTERRFTFSADALFAFDKSAITDISSGGREQLESLAHDIASHEGASVKVTGYTDRLGAAAYNDALSKRRADSVMDYLVQHGVAADSITAEGLGAASPVTTDCHQKNRAQLIACLAPDRRVEVVVHSK